MEEKPKELIALRWKPLVGCTAIFLGTLAGAYGAWTFALAMTYDRVKP